MQGEATSQSIIAALERIYSNIPLLQEGLGEVFDCVVIIRGGGATSDMSGFDTLELAENVANFPIPIITGIGHDRDESILDMVSHTRVKTPTAAAAFLISHLKEVLDALNDSQRRIANYCGSKLSTLNAQLSTLQAALPRLFPAIKAREERRIEALSSRMMSGIQQRLLSQQARISMTEQKLPMMALQKLTTEKHRLEMMEEKTKMLDPALLLKRGYSITLFGGKTVRDPMALRPGDEIETRVEKGTIKSIIKA